MACKNHAVYPGEVKIEVLDPIKTDDWNRETVDKHVEEVRSFMAKAL